MFSVSCTTFIIILELFIQNKPSHAWGNSNEVVLRNGPLSKWACFITDKSLFRSLVPRSDYKS